MKKHKSKQKSKKAILIDRPPLNLAFNPEVIYLGKGDNLLEVNLRKSIRAKSVRIKILASQNIELVIPHNASSSQIKQAHQFLQQQEKELRAKLAELEPIMAIAKGIPKSLPIFDQEHPIVINISTLKETVLHENDQLIVCSRGNESKIEWLLVNYLQQLIAKEISVYVELISKKLQVTYKKITIKDVRSYWGCYSTNGHLSFSWRIVFAPRHIMEYIVVHELCHILEQNHSKRFWQLVEQNYPEYQKAELWLKQHGVKLSNLLAR